MAIKHPVLIALSTLSIIYVSTASDHRGINPHPDLCDAAKIPGVPTWVINSHQYSGVQNLKDLAKASGYKGDKNFKYVYTP